MENPRGFEKLGFENTSDELRNIGPSAISLAGRRRRRRQYMGRLKLLYEGRLVSAAISRRTRTRSDAFELLRALKTKGNLDSAPGVRASVIDEDDIEEK